MPRRAFARADLVAALAAVVMGACLLCVLGAGVTRHRMFTPSQANLLQIGQAGAAYQGDFQGHLPMAPIWQHRGVGPAFPNQSANGWAAWSYGGKNTSSYWYSAFGGYFDVEAADRPLNAYVYPGRVFPAPVIPNRMSPSDPTRATTQASVFRDPGDMTTRQRNWPNATVGVSCYDDTGSSYHLNGAWVESPQLAPFSFTNRYLVGMGRIATGQGITPSRFVWNADQFAAIVVYGTNPLYQVRNDYEDINRSQMLFLDGHAAYLTVAPGQFNTAAYQMRLE